MMTPEELLTTTRTVRKRLDFDRPVPLDLVKHCVQVALQAPSGSNTQRWQWLVVTDADQRAALGEIYRRACHEYLDVAERGRQAVRGRPRAGRGAEARRRQRRVPGRPDGRRPGAGGPCLETASAELPAGNQAGMWASLLPAVWSYMLAARSVTLGTAWTTLHLKYEQEAAEVLGLPKNVHQAALIPTAFYTGDTFKPAARQPLEEVLHLDRW